MRRRAATLLICLPLGGCAILQAPEPARAPESPWALERAIEECRGGVAAEARGVGTRIGPVVIGAGVAAATVAAPSEAPDCPSLLALDETDRGEIRTLVQAVAASARGLDTNWENAAKARREIALSVYPEAGGGECRVVAATITLFAPRPDPRAPRRPPATAPVATPLPEQRLCRNPAGQWEPGPMTSR